MNTTKIEEFDKTFYCWWLKYLIFWGEFLDGTIGIISLGFFQTKFSLIAAQNLMIFKNKNK